MTPVTGDRRQDRFSQFRAFYLIYRAASTIIPSCCTHITPENQYAAVSDKAAAVPAAESGKQLQGEAVIVNALNDFLLDSVDFLLGWIESEGRNWRRWSGGQPASLLEPARLYGRFLLIYWHL